MNLHLAAGGGLKIEFARVAELSDRVRVTLFSKRRDGPQTLDLRTYCFRIELEKPLNGRAVEDGAPPPSEPPLMRAAELVPPGTGWHPGCPRVPVRAA